MTKELVIHPKEEEMTKAISSAKYLRFRASGGSFFLAVVTRIISEDRDSISFSIQNDDNVSIVEFTSSGVVTITPSSV